MMTRAALLFLLLAFAGLALRGLNEPDESRYGEVAREMWVAGDLLVPRLKGTPHLTKPPFTYWVTASAQALFGFGPWGMRFWPALAAAGTALLLFDFGRRSGGARRGFLCGLVFLTTLESFALGRILTTDMLLTFWATLALHARWRAAVAPEGRPARGAAWWFWIALGMGFLTKGPVVLLVVLGALLGARWTAPGLRLGRDLKLLAGLPVFAALGLSWFALIVARDPALLDFFLGGEVVDRVAGGRGRAKPFWYFLLILPAVLLPYPAVALRAFFGGIGSRARHREDDPTLAMARGWILVPFIGFSLAASKLWTYLLPMIPAFSILVAARLDAFIATGRSDWALAVTRALWAPARLFARLFGTAAPSARRLREVLGGLLFVTLLWQGVVAFVATREESLGHNASYDAFWSAVSRRGGEGLVGARIDAGLAARTELPPFPPEGLAVASYALRAPSASYALLGRRPEFVPNYEGRSIWKIAARANAERRFLAEDLVALVEERREVLVLVKEKDEAELRALLVGCRFETRARGGQGKSAALALLVTRAP